MQGGRSIPQRLGILVLLSVVCGLLLAGLALPVVGGTGLAINAANSALAKLPSYLYQPPLAQHSLLLAADGSTIATLTGPEDRVVVPLSDIPDSVQKSIVAIEDNRFYEHHGVDLRGLLRAIKTDNSDGDYAQGASTITQQYVKNVLLEQATDSTNNPTAQAAAEQAATEKSINRKLREARLAIALEKVLTKDQILDDYLNIAYFGEGVYGVGTAAEHYFGIPIQQVNLAQAALLAGLVNDPSGDDPVAHPAAAMTRRTQVLDALAKYKLLPAEQIAQARRTPIVVHPAPRAIDPCSVSTAPFYCRYVLDQLLSDTAFGATQAARDNEIYEGGLDIYTDLDPTVQAAVDAGIAKHLPDTIRQVESVVVEQPGTGDILAIGQNRKYGTGPGESDSVFAADENFQVGSTFKAITLAAALQAGIPLTTAIPSPNCLYIASFTPTDGDSCHGIKNAGDGEACDCNLYTGTWDSVNTFYVQLEERVGVSAVAAMAKKLGVVGGPGFQAGDYGLSLTLGAAGGLSVIDMATAYNTINDHGMYCPPSIIDHVTTLSGAAYPDGSAAPACTQAITSTIADTVTSVLQGVLTEPGATGEGLGLGRPAAGKTGTLDNSIGAWFAGYVPQYTTVVGLFDPQLPSSPATPICDLTGPCYETSNDLYGATIPGHTWQSIMEEMVSGEPVEDFAIPAALSPTAKFTVPIVAGMSEAAAGETLEAVGLIPNVSTASVDSAQPAGTVASTSPPAGSAIGPGATVTLILSNGKTPPTPSNSVSPSPSKTPATPPPSNLPPPAGGAPPT